MFSNKFSPEKCILLSLTFFYFFIYLLPFFVAPWVDFYHNIFVFISLALLAVYIVVTVDHWVLCTVNLITVLLAIFPLLLLASELVHFTGDAILVSTYLAGAALAILCGQNLLIANKRQHTLIIFTGLMCAVGVMNVFFAINQYYDLDLAKGFLAVTDGRPYGNLKQANNFASVLVLSFLSGWYIFESGRIQRWVFYSWLILIITGLVLAQSRTTLLVFIVLAIFWGLFHTRLSFRTRWFDLVYIAITYLLLWWLLPEIKQWLSASTIEGLRPINATDNARLAIWYESLLAIWQGPLWGYGWNQIGVAQVLVDSPLEHIVHFRHAHNLFLDLLLYNGPILGGLMVLAILWLIVKAFRDCHSIEGWFILAMIGAIFTHAMVELPLHYAYFLLPVGFLLGLIDTAPSKPSSIITIPSWYLLPVVAVGFSIMAIIWHDYRIIHKEHFRLNLEMHGTFARKPESEKTEQIILLTQRKAHLNYGRMSVTPNMSDEQLHWMKQVSHRFASPYYLSKYARANHLNNRPQEAERVLKVVKRLFGNEMYEHAKTETYKP